MDLLEGVANFFSNKDQILEVSGLNDKKDRISREALTEYDSGKIQQIKEAMRASWEDPSLPANRQLEDELDKEVEKFNITSQELMAMGIAVNIVPKIVS